ncbi:L-selectin-like [Denticeps clupeoides]|uniref:L-selectin-like n=1 Tax=Denticeps clupeoides TaxID=299321 RepID=UPI0010A394EE|nr:L-selectin-like [Denticeps clupeoides]
MTAERYILVAVGGNWKQAQTYCRQQYTDLVSLRNSTENSYASLAVGGNTAWIGMYKGSWTWSDQNNLIFQNWGSGQPDNTYGCGGIYYSQSIWQDMPCDWKIPFVCYGALKQKMVVRVNISSVMDLEDLDVQTSVFQQIEDTLKKGGMYDQANLTWNEQEYGNVFENTDATTSKKRNKREDL